MDNPRKSYESKLTAALHLSQRLLTAPIPSTNCRLEEVARITTRRAKEALRQLSGGDHVTSSADFATAWKEFTDAESAMDHWHARSQRYAKAIRDLKVMYTHYLSLKYEYRSYEEFRNHQVKCKNELGRPPSPGPAPTETKIDVIGALAGNLDAYLLLGKKLWQGVFAALQMELHRLHQWERELHGLPKSKAPLTPNFSWLMGILELFVENDIRRAMAAISFAVADRPDPFKAMSFWHVRLVNRSQERLALNEVDGDLGSLAAWVPNEYNTELLERAIVSYRFKVLDYMSKARKVQDGVQLQ
ncbi:uncharacterized protein PG986_001011 [Apiospora aurea]|uniref:Uncharacterized protein n=1 Tax=Apiospora aurea TaxID=335848 RepID=A0ABR1QVU3_9PEZI